MNLFNSAQQRLQPTGFWVASLVGLGWFGLAGPALAQTANPETEKLSQQTVSRGLNYLASVQARDGRWEGDGGMYRVPLTALAGMCFLMDGNTVQTGPYAKNVQAAVGFLLTQAQSSGLIGVPDRDNRYMYGHGFSMLFLSQVLGEEEDMRRREEIHRVLTKAVLFCGKAQTDPGGWGYITARDGRGFDEGSVTITQMQALRSCRNAGIEVPREIVEKGISYIRECTDEQGGVRYSLQTHGGARAPITAAAVACLFNAGQEDDPLAKRLLGYAEKNLKLDNRNNSFGHWHYAHYYFSQVMYRLGDEKWLPYRDAIVRILHEEQRADGSWDQGYIGPVYTTTLNLTILQLDKGLLPIYQR